MANLWTTQECGIGKDWPIRCSGEIVAIAQDGETARLICAAVNGRAALVTALETLAWLGEEGMTPNPEEWLTFHDKVAEVARAALKNAESV